MGDRLRIAARQAVVDEVGAITRTVFSVDGDELLVFRADGYDGPHYQPWGWYTVTDGESIVRVVGSWTLAAVLADFGFDPGDTDDVIIAGPFSVDSAPWPAIALPAEMLSVWETSVNRAVSGALDPFRPRRKLLRGVQR